MSTNKDEPAFPDEKNSGLTKREYFATIALQGLLSGRTVPISDSNIKDYVARSVKISDRLIEELNNK